LYRVGKSHRSRRKPPAPKQPLQRGEYKSLALAIEARATRQGLSVRALAERLGMPSTRVHKTLRCQRRLDPLEFLDWCEALDIEDPVGFLRAIKKSL
jgi:hypothetical protein